MITAAVGPDGSTSRRATWMSDTVAFLSSVPLFEGIPEAEPGRARPGPGPPRRAGGRDPVARGGRGGRDAPGRRRARVGLAALPATGRSRSPAWAGAARRDPAARRRPALGIGARDGAASLLSLSRADFAALVSRRHPTAFALKRRIAHVACARLRRQLANAARSLGGGAAEERPPGTRVLRRRTNGYVRRLASFRRFGSLAPGDS